MAGPNEERRCAYGDAVAMTQKVSLNVNGTDHTVEADPDTPLLYVLRDDLGLNNPHFGCGLGQCGACTVHLDGKPTRSCRRPISEVGDQKVVTLAGLGTPEQPHPLQTAYVRRTGAAMRLLHQRLDHDRRGLPARQQEADRRPDPRPRCSRVKCRCGTHMAILRAVKRAAAMMG